MKPHPCEIIPGEFEHDMEYMENEIGDPGVIMGTYVEKFYRCRDCGLEEKADGPPDDDWY